jgi:hypothetical protein
LRRNALDFAADHFQSAARQDTGHRLEVSGDACRIGEQAIQRDESGDRRE